MPMSALRVFLGAALLAAAAAWAAPSPAAEGLKQIRDRMTLTIDRGRISVSGVSSGGWMANQVHVAHSAKIMGAGILAAGPYHCAAAPSVLCDYTPYGFWMPHDSCQAIHLCTRLARQTFGSVGLYVGPPDAADSVESTLDEAADGTIDPVAGLKGDRVWLFSGGKDDLAPTEVMDELEKYYAALFARPEVANPAANVAYIRDERAAHAMIVAVPEQEDTCGVFGPPYIDDCDYDAAGTLLSFIYQLGSGPAPAHGSWDQGSLFAFDQTPFFDAAEASISLNKVGHVYVPAACRQGASCPLHVAFHGCNQDEDAVKRACADTGDCPALYFFKDAGYNEWAERHGIVVLYPQATAWGVPGDGTRNPQGCWDWWGYSGDDYFRKSAPQITAVDAMIDCLSGARPCP